MEMDMHKNMDNHCIPDYLQCCKHLWLMAYRQKGLLLKVQGILLYAVKTVKGSHQLAPTDKSHLSRGMR